jgi:hypothetical protein
LVAKPLAGMVEQFASRFDIVEAFEKAEEAYFVVVSPVVSAIDDPHHPADNVVATANDERLTAVFFVKRVWAKADQFVLDTPDRRHPIRVAGVDLALDLDELASVGGGLNGTTLRGIGH